MLAHIRQQPIFLFQFFNSGGFCCGHLQVPLLQLVHSEIIFHFFQTVRQILPKPNKPPSTNNAKLFCSERCETAHCMQYKLGIVIKNPILLTMVMAVARYSGMAFWATKAENCGESATTAMPHISMKIKKITVGKNGMSTESKQQVADVAKAQKASRALPHSSDNSPPNTQPAAPAAMMPNDQADTSNPFPVARLYNVTSTGAKAQKVYNSHMWPKYPNANVRYNFC